MLDTATRTGRRPFQLTHGPPSEDTMAFYQCRYVGTGGFVNDRVGHVVIAQDQRGLWFVSSTTQLMGIEF